MSDALEQKYRTSHLHGGNAAFVEEFYERFLEDPASVPREWRSYFENLVDGHLASERRHGPIQEAILERTRAGRPRAQAGVSGALLEKQTQVLLMVDAFRLRGHRMADLDPLGLSEPAMLPDLDPAGYGFGDEDMQQAFGTGNFAGPAQMPLEELVAALREAYCGRIGWEFMHITDNEQRTWLQEKIEASRSHYDFSEQDRKLTLKALTAAEGIERYLHTKYVGQKRFSLEGGESLIVALEDLVHGAGRDGTDECIIGMAHRGRINVLVNVLGKSPKELFAEFEGGRKAEAASGDVKYHLGFSSDIQTEGGNLHVVLAFNPSHLEIVNPVVEGSVRARQERRDDRVGDSVLPVLIHGDAAFAGQGVVTETLQMSQARGFYTGGTVHFVVNNQIGFTTSDKQDARSTLYCTDVAKMVEVPIFHVNGDDPEAVLFVTRLAYEYRRRFHRDVVIDLVCYRRHGHNEADEPAVTQPRMYSEIRQHPGVRKLYAEKLEKEGVVDADEIKAMGEAYRKDLEEGDRVARANLGMVGNEYTVDWSRFNRDPWTDDADTAISKSRVRELSERLGDLPEDLNLHDRVAAIVRDRGKMAAGEIPMDWGFAETMAYASLVKEGFGVRLVGQDSGRGTFFHRHAVLHDQGGDKQYVPLANISEDQGRFTVIDSLLSEEAVVGFEYGYSSAEPDVLPIWEAQFGDFCNGAQVVIDQFISSGETKWGRYSGLTMYLPHGFEGQGPEHSSARLERFLQLCAQHNMQVCVPSTPAQFFHMIRRQMRRNLRKPLIVLTPKSLLRHKLSTSTLEDLTKGRFHTLIPEIDEVKPAKVRRVVFCAGKVYYDLLSERRKREMDDVAIVRIEQLYPFPVEAYAEQLKTYSYAREVVWCQEEPMNQGAWYQIRHRLQEPLKAKHDLIYAGREASAAPAVGYYELHKEQQERLVRDALKLSD